MFPLTSTLPKDKYAVPTQLFILKPSAGTPAWVVEIPSPKIVVWFGEEAKEIEEAVALFILTTKLLPEVTLAWGSTKVKVPAVKFIFVDSELKIPVALATEVATEPEFPSITIAPPDWLKTDVVSALLIFPLTFNVPPEIVNVPLLIKGVLLFVHPTVKSPEEIIKVPVFEIVVFEALFATLFTVTVCPALIKTPSVQTGTVPLLQIEALFQLPEAIDEFDISDEFNPK